MEYSIYSFLCMFPHMTRAVGLTVSKIGGDRRSEGSGHSEKDYNSLKMQSKIIILMDLNVCYMTCLDGGLLFQSASIVLWFVAVT